MWGAIGMNFRSDLVVCSNHEDSEEYKRILMNSQLIEKCDMKFGFFG